MDLLEWVFLLVCLFGEVLSGLVGQFRVCLDAVAGGFVRLGCRFRLRLFSRILRTLLFAFAFILVEGSSR